MRASFRKRSLRNGGLLLPIFVSIWWLVTLSVFHGEFSLFLSVSLFCTRQGRKILLIDVCLKGSERPDIL